MGGPDLPRRGREAHSPLCGEWPWGGKKNTAFSALFMPSLNKPKRKGKGFHSKQKGNGSPVLTLCLFTLTTVSPPPPKCGPEAPAAGCGVGGGLSSDLGLRAESRGPLSSGRGPHGLQLPLGREPTGLFLRSCSRQFLFPDFLLSVASVSYVLVESISSLPNPLLPLELLPPLSLVLKVSPDHFL